MHPHTKIHTIGGAPHTYPINSELSVHPHRLQVKTNTESSKHIASVCTFCIIPSTLREYGTCKSTGDLGYSRGVRYTHYN